MTESLLHRGPDSSGFFDEMVKDKFVFLGHRRLKIIDLSENGNQPMSTSDNKVHIVYNGEVYNFQELKSKYLKEYHFNSKTDTEVILYLYDKFGISFIEKLNGDFAIAILDTRRTKIYLIRDRLGVKPLYYHFGDQSLLFSSEIKAILKSGLDFRLSEEQIQSFFVFKYVPGQFTLFQGIQRLKPGYFLEYDFVSNAKNLKPYWQLKKDGRNETLSYEKSKERLFELLKESTNIRLISDVPVGTFFSGGLDSSIIAYFLKDVEEITHYSARKSLKDIKKEGTSADFEYAERLTKEFNLNTIPIDIGSQEANIDQIKETIYFSDDLIADGSQIPSFLITKEASKFSKVMLSGMGADELFHGYGGHLLILLSGYFDKLPKWVAKSISKRMGTIYQGRGFLKGYRRFLRKIGRYYQYPSYKLGLYSIVGDFSNSKSIFNGNDELITNFISSYFENDEDPFDNITRFELDNFLVKNLHYVDRMCMANSVEGRVPFLDHNVVEYAYNTPTKWKLSSTGVAKKILKDMIRPHLPSYIVDRRKAGFGMPLRSIFSDREKINELLNLNFYGDMENFSVKNINKIITNHISGEEDNSSIIYALIAFQEWYKIFLN